MQRFRYQTRTGDIVSSTDVDLILREDNCLLVVNKGSFLNPKIVYARREQGIVIEREQLIELKYLSDLLFEYDYLPVYYIGFSKGNITKLQKQVNVLKEKHEEVKDSEEEIYNDFLKDLKRNRERWLLRQASVDKVRNSFENNLRNNTLSFIDKEERKQEPDINDIIDEALTDIPKESLQAEISFDEQDFIPKKKVRN